jgi:D-3-phosphoglycerate dehydrogenase
MRVIAHDPFLTDGEKAEYSAFTGFVEMKELLVECDVLSIHVPLTEQTRGIVGSAEISLMKPDALLINTSRGGVVNEPALIEALIDRRIGGAGLDVFAEEPISEDNPLLKLENVLLTPHTAALTKECVVRMAMEAAKCVVDVFAFREPPNVANREVLAYGRWKQ